jgi:hypothetical protein
MKKILFFLLIVNQASAQCVLPILTDFECSEPAVGSYPTTLTTVSNFDKTGINSSENIGKYDDDGTAAFDAIIFDYGTAIDLSTNNFLKLKFHTTKEVQLLIKLEGGSDQREFYSNFVSGTELNTWVEFVFDFSAYSNNSSGGDGNTKLVIFVNPGVTSGNNPDTYYLDDIIWDSSATASTIDNSLSKATVFPSIFEEYLNVKSEEVIKEVNVFNINGKSVFTKTKINSTEDRINLSKLSKGYYFIKIVTEKAILNSKVYKQ